jgi:hypothetical protein
MFGGLRPGEADGGPFADVPRQAAKQRVRGAQAEEIGAAADARERRCRAGGISRIARSETGRADREMQIVRQRNRRADEIATACERRIGCGERTAGEEQGIGIGRAGRHHLAGKIDLVASLKIETVDQRNARHEARDRVAAKIGRTVVQRRQSEGLAEIDRTGERSGPGLRRKRSGIEGRRHGRSRVRGSPNGERARERAECAAEQSPHGSYDLKPFNPPQITSRTYSIQVSL